HDLALSARRADRLAGHDLVGAVLLDGQRDVVRLGVGLVHDTFPRASHGLALRYVNGREWPEAGATDQQGREPDDGGGESGPERSRAAQCHSLSPPIRVNNWRLSTRAVLAVETPSGGCR